MFLQNKLFVVKHYGLAVQIYFLAGELGFSFAVFALHSETESHESRCWLLLYAARNRSILKERWKVLFKKERLSLKYLGHFSIL